MKLENMFYFNGLIGYKQKTNTNNSKCFKNIIVYN